MNTEEILSTIEQLRAEKKSEGKDEETGDKEILDSFFTGFQEGKMSKEDLKTLANAMGYDLSPEFAADTTPDPISSPEISESEAEDLKEIKPGETAAEFKEKVDEAKKVNVPEAEKEKPAESDEDAEWKEAKKSFGLDDDKKVPEKKEEEKDEDWEKARKYYRL